MSIYTGPPTLEEIEEYLAYRGSAMYHNEELLEEIREFTWEGLRTEALTESNTKKNSEYERCRILHKMARAKKPEIQTELYTPARIKIEPSPTPMEKISGTPGKDLKNQNYPKPILKLSSGAADVHEKIEKYNVYVERTEKDSGECYLLFSPCKKDGI